MESSTTFRFREHHQAEDATEPDTDSDTSSVSGDRIEEAEMESMTGKGIRRLCMELLEIKEASDEDFHANILANYSAFFGIHEEVKDMERELMQLKTHVSTQKMLVKDLIDGLYLNVLSEEIIESADELIFDESFPINELEVHIRNVSETLDILISENRTDEAISVLEMEQENLQKLHLEDDISSDLLSLYSNAVSERKTMLILQLSLVAENSRTFAPELQKALLRICRLGNSNLATQLLLKYYHSRIASGIHKFQRSNTCFHGFSTKELTRFMFSEISQAAKSFVMLYGETSSYESEFNQWVQQEIEVFSVLFAKFVSSRSDISGRLSTAIEAVQFAITYCLLLETQGLVLQPLLIKNLRACMEDVFLKHINHFKKVISIITANDSWILGRYLVSGILNEDYSYIVIGQQQPEYCMLTNSGRKFITLLQAILKDVTPLAAFHMENSVIVGLRNLFMEYIAILKKAITYGVNVLDKSGSGVSLAEPVPQQVSILANLSTLEHFFSSTISNIFRGNSIDTAQEEGGSIGVHQQGHDTSVMFILEASAQLRNQFFQQFIDRLSSLDVCKLELYMSVYSETSSSLGRGLMPSSVFQMLFLELRKLNKLSEDNVYEANWLRELISELIEAIFAWISENKQIWETNEGNLNTRHSDFLNQFVLDMYFLVEAARYGEYFSKDPFVPAMLMKSAFESAGFDPIRDIDDDGWAMKAATEAIKRMVEIEKKELELNDTVVDDLAESPDNHSEHASETLQDTDISSQSADDEEKIMKDVEPDKIEANN